MARQAAIATDVFKTVLTLNFGDGRTLEVDTMKLSETIKLDAMLHGLKAKLIDGAAIARNNDNGKSATLDDKYNAVKEIFDRITSANGTWNKGRAEVMTPKTKEGLLVRALMQMTGKDKPYVEDFLSAKTKEERQALMTNARVVEIINSYAPASTVDTDALLGELGANVESTNEQETATDEQDDTSALEFEQPAPTIQQQVQAALNKPKRVKKEVTTV